MPPSLRPSGLLPCVFEDRSQANCRQSETPTCLGNFLGNRDSRINVIPIKIGIFRANSMVSGPNFRRRSLAFRDVRQGGKTQEEWGLPDPQ